MLPFNKFSTEDQIEVLQNASIWKKQHENYISELVDFKKSKFPPSGSDCLHPELWKGGHWAWFLEKGESLLNELTKTL